MSEQVIGGLPDRRGAGGPPRLAAATANGGLLRYLQELTNAQGWQFTASLTASETLASLTSQPLDMLLIDVFLEDQNGFELRGEIRRHPAAAMAPILLIAPGCSDAADLEKRLDFSASRFQTAEIDEEGLTRRIRELMDDSTKTELTRAHFRYATFLQVAGETCHAANQPLTSLICNLELVLHQDMDETTRRRLKTCHEGAVKIMRTIQQLQQAKWGEDKDIITPVYLLPRRVAAARGSTAERESIKP